MTTSDEDVLRAVERYLSGRGRDVRLVVPTTARLTRRTLLDFRIVRRTVVRGRPVPRSIPGKRLSEISKRPSYTDLATHPVEVPSGFAEATPVTLVLEGSVAETPCRDRDCDGGKVDCTECGASGRVDCPKTVKCRGCGGGVDACWSCAGTEKKGTRKPPANARSNQARTDWCRLCGEHDVACPKCLGKRTKPCGVCKGKGFRTCDTCDGDKRLKHGPCGGSGFVTTFTEVEIRFPVERDKVRVRDLPHLWWPTSPSRASWREKRLTDVTDKLPADLPDTLRARVEPKLALINGEATREATLRYLPVARVTVVDDLEWVYFAFPDRQGPDALKVVRRPSKQVVLRVSGIAAASVVIAVLVTVLVVSAIG
ncbi:hypothetical protein OG241_29570 [Streptomyces sp. NBC_01390]|uniref:hypothetical protein n=1 Tax=Streptomyces sp. NBC_01390 TaxID=2903850 RepID=UPI0032515293